MEKSKIDLYLEKSKIEKINTFSGKYQLIILLIIVATIALMRFLGIIKLNIILTNIFYLFFIIAVFSSGFFIKQKINFKINQKEIKTILGIVVLMFLIGYFVASILKNPISQNEQVARRLITNPQTFFISAVFVIFLAPIVEEIVFRGLILEFLAKWISPIIGFILVSILFAGIHITSEIATKSWIEIMQYITPYLVGSAIINFYYIKTRKLANVIYLHALYNGVHVLFLLLIK